MTTQIGNLHVNPSDETIRLGPLGVRFLITGENANGSVAVFEKEFFKRLKDRGCEARRSSTERACRGLTLAGAAPRAAVVVQEEAGGDGDPEASFRDFLDQREVEAEIEAAREAVLAGLEE